MKRSRAHYLRSLIEQAAVSLDDETALTGIELFPAWKENAAYDVGDRISWGGKLYRCVQAHSAQADWAPDVAPALWTEVARPGEIPVWRQPSGAQDAYRTGDRVRYPDEHGAVYESLADANVYSPEAWPAGWLRLG